MTRLLFVEVQARDGRRFSFNFYGDPGYLPEWRAAGLDVGEILNTVPEWWPWPRVWCFVQDVLHLKNPWSTDVRPNVCLRCRWEVEGRCTRFGLTAPWAWRCNAFERRSR